MSEGHRDSGNRTVLIVVGIIAGLVLILFLGCGGLVFLVIRQVKPLIEAGQQMFKNIQETKTLGETFLAEIRAGKLDAAYAMTSPGFKQQTSREAFEAFVKEHTILKQSLKLDADPPDVMAMGDGEKGTCKYQVKRPGKQSSEFTLRFIKENGLWAIDGLDADENGAVESAARGFVEAVKAKWNDSAYQLTTTQFRTKWNRAALEAFLMKHPVPTGYDLDSPFDEDGNGKNFSVRLRSPGGAELFELHLRREGAGSRVDDLKEADE